MVEYGLSLPTTFLLIVLTKYFCMKRYWRKCEQKCSENVWRFFGSWRALTFFAWMKFDCPYAQLWNLVYNPWKLEVDISNSFREHFWTKWHPKFHKNVNIWRNNWRFEKQKNPYKIQVNIYHPWKFDENRTTHIREIACTKFVRKKIRIIIIIDKKLKNNNKVFRWKRKTLTRFDLVASNE